MIIALGNLSGRRFGEIDYRNPTPMHMGGDHCLKYQPPQLKNVEDEMNEPPEWRKARMGMEVLILPVCLLTITYFAA